MRTAREDVEDRIAALDCAIQVEGVIIDGLKPSYEAWGKSAADGGTRLAMEYLNAEKNLRQFKVERDALTWALARIDELEAQIERYERPGGWTWLRERDARRVLGDVSRSFSGTTISEWQVGTPDDCAHPATCDYRRLVTLAATKLGTCTGAGCPHLVVALEENER